MSDEPSQEMAFRSSLPTLPTLPMRPQSRATRIIDRNSITDCRRMFIVLAVPGRPERFIPV